MMMMVCRKIVLIFNTLQSWQIKRSKSTSLPLLAPHFRLRNYNSMRLERIGGSVISATIHIHSIKHERFYSFQPGKLTEEREKKYNLRVLKLEQEASGVGEFVQT